MSAAFDLTLTSTSTSAATRAPSTLIRDEERWRDYILHALVEPHLERDLLAMTRVDKPALLKNLFELGAAYSGQILSYNKMLGQLLDAGNTTTLARYLDLLSTAGLLTGLPKHSGSSQRRRASSPKLNVLNTALMTAASRYSFAEAKADRTFWGRLVESAVGAHLFNTAPPNLGMSYWRDGPHEVDFVLRRGPRVVGIEVKSGDGRANDRAMRAFEERFDAPRPLVVGEGGIPLNEFLSAPAHEMVRRTMTHIVARTCTRVPRPQERPDPEASSEPLSAFRSETAYILLGDPGSGKTTAFKRECEELGEASVLLDARDFLVLDLARYPEWKDKTLFIDGLDEVRAGSSDRRTPLDDIRRRLDALGRPSFRISCREADWLGENDRARLDAVAPSAAVTTLRLDPLTPSGIERILGSHPGIEDARAFVERAGERGVDALLTNPQTLNMLADVVSKKAGWPESRLETFEMACLQMATEHNEEHALGDRPPGQDQLLDAAGYLCATQLVTGAAGHSRRNGEADPDFLALGDCDYPDSSALDHAIGTKLFGAVGGAGSRLSTAMSPSSWAPGISRGAFGTGSPRGGCSR